MNEQTESLSKYTVFGRNDGLSELAAKIRKNIGSGRQGPLILAREIVALADRWEEFKSEADGLTFSQWIVGVSGAGCTLAWWERRDHAVRRIGEECRRQLDHEVAVYVDANVPDEHLITVTRMLYIGTKENGGVPLTKAQAERRIRKIVGAQASKKTCSNCRRLEALLRAHGIDPNEEIH